MRRIINALLAVTLALPMAARAQDQPAAVLRLDDALRLAADSNRQLKIAELDVQKAQERVSAATKKRYPQFSFTLLESQLLTELAFTVEQGQFGSFPGIGPVPPDRTRITTPAFQPTAYAIGSVQQPLSQLYRIGLSIDSQEVGEEIARESLRQSRQDLVDRVQQAFYAMLQTQSSLEYARETLKYVEELEQLTDRYLVQQVVLRSDALNVKAQVARARYQIVTLRDTLATQQENFNILLGRDVRTRFEVSPADEPTPIELNLDAARAKAVAERSEVKQARLKSQQAHLDYRAEHAKYIPDISLSLNYYSAFNVDFLPKNVASLGLYLNWEPFDWGYKRRELAEKALTIQQADYSTREAEDAVLIDVGNRFRKLQETRALLEVTRLAQATEREKLRVVSAQYKVKAALLKDTLAQQASLADANNQYQQALLSYWTAKASFEKALGGS
jgi:outer membrane protein TolC